MTKELKTGQSIYLRPVGNAARRSSEIIEANVTKVGRKYFEVERYGRFFLEDLRQDNGQYITNYVAYTDIQQIEDENEKNRLLLKIEDIVRFAPKKITLEQLRSIDKILSETL